MTLEEAKLFLAQCVRNTLSDYAFGDSEVSWSLDDKVVASGYFGSTTREVVICGTSFEGEDAQALRYRGTLGRAARNDSGGSGRSGDDFLDDLDDFLYEE